MPFDVGTGAAHCRLQAVVCAEVLGVNSCGDGRQPALQMRLLLVLLLLVICMKVRLVNWVRSSSMLGFPMLGTRIFSACLTLFGLSGHSGPPWH